MSDIEALKERLQVMRDHAEKYSHVSASVVCRDALAAIVELERDRVDAERYRWFRQNGDMHEWGSCYRIDELDDAIDAALRNETKGDQ